MDEFVIPRLASRATQRALAALALMTIVMATVLGLATNNLIPGLIVVLAVVGFLWAVVRQKTIVTSTGLRHTSFLGRRQFIPYDEIELISVQQNLAGGAVLYVKHRGYRPQRIYVMLALKNMYGTACLPAEALERLLALAKRLNVAGKEKTVFLLETQIMYLRQNGRMEDSPLCQTRVFRTR